MDKKFERIYYSDDGYWRGKSAIQKLSRASGSTKEETEKWLLKQSLYQIYLPLPKCVPRPNSIMSLYASPNDIHQADIQISSTDPIWSVDVYKIKDRYVQKYQPTLYHLDGGPKRSFVYEELQQIPDPSLLVPTLMTRRVSNK